MTKPTNPSKLTANDYRLISEEAGVSFQTVTKWFSNTLSVRHSTEQKIISAWLVISTRMDDEIDKRIHDNKVVISRLQTLNKELQNEKKALKKRLSEFIKLDSNI